MASKRFEAKGQLADYREQLERLKIQVDGVVKNLLDVFSPMDSGLTYVLKIDSKRMDVHVVDIKKKLKEAKQVQAEIERLSAELGEDE